MQILASDGGTQSKRDSWRDDSIAMEECKRDCDNDEKMMEDLNGVPPSWASWLTVDDGRTVEQVRIDSSRRQNCETRDASRFSREIESPELLQQMNLFMQIDETNDDTEECETKSCAVATPPSPNPKRRRSNEILRVEPAKPLSRHRHRLSDTTPDASKSQVSGNHLNTSAQNTNNAPRLYRRGFSGRERRQNMKPIVASSRKERHSFGDKLKIAFGVKSQPETYILGEKTARLLQAVDSLQNPQVPSSGIPIHPSIQ